MFENFLNKRMKQDFTCSDEELMLRKKLMIILSQTDYLALTIKAQLFGHNVLNEMS